MEYFLAILQESFFSVQLISLAEPTFYALKGFGGHDMALPVLAASIGSTVGQAVNLMLGRFLLHLKQKGQIYLNEKAYQTGVRLARGWLLPLLLFCWSLFGSGLVMAAGFFNLSWQRAMPVIALGQAAYYLWQGFY